MKSIDLKTWEVQALLVGRKTAALRAMKPQPESAYASLFAGSLAYAASHGLYLIFVGTGVLFSHTPLNMDSWGYLDTTQYFGTITQWGCAEFDTDSNTLCLSGRDSYGEYVCGLLRFHARFDYSNDGAWLPYIASSGVPAWIKAKPGGEA